MNRAGSRSPQAGGRRGGAAPRGDPEPNEVLLHCLQKARTRPHLVNVCAVGPIACVAQRTGPAVEASGGVCAGHSGEARVRVASVQRRHSD